MLRSLRPAVVMVCLVPLWTAASGARAQTVFLEGRGGVAVPTGEMANWVSAGPSFGGGLGLRLHPRLALRADFDASFLEGEGLEAGGEAPGINLIHYVAGLEAVLGRTTPSSSPLELAVGVFGGGTTLEIEAFTIPHDRPHGGQTFILSERYFTVGGNFRAGYGLSPSFSLFLAARAYGIFADEEDTKILELLSDQGERFGPTWHFPVTAGARLGF